MAWFYFLYRVFFGIFSTRESLSLLNVVHDNLTSLILKSHLNFRTKSQLVNSIIYVQEVTNTVILMIHITFLIQKIITKSKDQGLPRTQNSVMSNSYSCCIFNVYKTIRKNSNHNIFDLQLLF